MKCVWKIVQNRGFIYFSLHYLFVCYTLSIVLVVRCFLVLRLLQELRLLRRIFHSVENAALHLGRLETVALTYLLCPVFSFSEET